MSPGFGAGLVQVNTTLEPSALTVAPPSVAGRTPPRIADPPLAVGLGDALGRTPPPPTTTAMTIAATASAATTPTRMPIHVRRGRASGASGAITRPGAASTVCSESEDAATTGG